MTYCCDICLEQLDTLRFMVLWDGRVWTKSYRCARHVRVAPVG